MKADITRKVRFVAALIIIVFFSSAHAAIWYVDSTAPSPGSGTSWASPFHSIQLAINAANGFIPECNSPDQIWVKEGIFILSSELNMYKHVSLYGGFPSAGSPTMGDRDPDAYPTIISGAWGFVRLMKMTAISNIDGFTFQNGYTTGIGGAISINRPPLDCGAGLVVRVTIKNCQFIDNYAGIAGGAIYEEGSDIRIQNCNFYGNEAYNGGALRHDISSPIIEKCIFGNNITSVDTSSSSYAGGGAIQIMSAASIATYGSITNCLFYDNTSAGNGGALLILDYCSPSVTNCTFAGNSAASDGGAIYCIGSESPIRNSIFWNDLPNEIASLPPNPTVNYSNVSGGWAGAGTNNTNVNPIFVGGGDYHLTLGSPCIDTGLNFLAPSDDLEGSSRPYDGDGDGTATADKGAYELDDVVSTPAGTNVGVSIGGVSVTYETVNGAGNTHVSQSGTGPGVPADHQLSCTPPRYYDITTTATYSGTIEICIQYDPASCDESDLHLFHYEGGVWVDVTTSVDTVANIICGEVTSLSDFLLAGPTPAGLGCSDNDVHTATTGNIFSNWTEIDHPLTNDDPDAIVFVTQNWNPGGLGGTYNDAAIGVWYDGIKWAIFNQDISPMPEGAAFNFKVVPPSESVFIHTATVANIIAHQTVIDHPLTNGNPDALLFVTQNWNPGGVQSAYNDQAIGVWYNGSQWEIFNQYDFLGGGTTTDMPPGASFNVKVALPSESAFVHTATVGNILSHQTIIDHPMANGNPDAILLVTQNWNPGGGSGQYNDHSIGVWYNGFQWVIFNQDISAMVLGLDFNVMIFPTSDFFIHTATAGNIWGNTSDIDEVLTDDKPNALVFATQNWNPGGGDEVYNNSPIGVWYTGSKWSIFNQDNAQVPLGADFNIKVVPASESTFVHTATAANISLDATQIDHPFTNGNPDILLFATQNWNPGGLGATYNNAPIGVFYNGATWGIFNEDNSSMPENAAFNVKVVLPSESAFVHTATVDNITGFGHTTDIDHPITNGNPDAILLVTQNWNPGDGVGVWNNSPVGVWYNSDNSRWAIFNQYDYPGGGTTTDMLPGASFNVMVLTECELGCVPCACQEVDFNGDGIVNLADYARLAEAWLEHELLVDLAKPGAIVDEADLEEFMRHWLESCE